MLDVKAAERLLRSMKGRRVLVLGDVMLDEFLWGRVARISPEAPVPVVEVTDQSFRVGGAANVAANVRALGGEVALAGVVGRDAAGERVRGAIEEMGVLPLLVASDSGRPTTVKTRIIAHHQQVVRADREVSEDIADAVEDRLIAQVTDELRGTQALLLSDYQKGVITPRVMKAVLGAARRRKVPVFVDPKVRHFPLYRGVAVITPNHLEAEQATGMKIRSGADLAQAAARILKMLGCASVLITRGEQGMSLFRTSGRPVHIPTAAREVFDVTGAGDTVIATLTLAAAAGARLDRAAALANDAAGVVVGKLGTSLVSPAELVAAVEARSAS